MTLTVHDPDEIRKAAAFVKALAELECKFGYALGFASVAIDPVGHAERSGLHVSRPAEGGSLGLGVGAPDTDAIMVRTMDQEHPEPLAAWERELLNTGPRVGDRYRDCDGDVWTYQADGLIHLRTDSAGTEFAEVERDFAPLVKLGPDD